MSLVAGPSWRGGTPGLLLRVLSLLRKPPVFVPWAGIVGSEPVRLFLLPGYRVVVGNPAVATVTVWAGLYSAIYPHLTDVPPSLQGLALVTGVS